MLLTRISSDLQDAGIPFHAQTEMDHKHMPHMLLPMGLQYGKRGFRIFVLRSDLERARALIADVLDSPDVPENYLLNEWNEPLAAPSLVELHEYDETVQVWRGADLTLAKSIGDCFRENSIACRSEVSGSEETISVRVADEPLAREIIRQVLEGVPPD